MCVVTYMFVILLWGLPLSHVEGATTITRPENVSGGATTIARPENISDTEGICGDIDVRNSARELEKLRGCRVVEGFVQIVLIDYANESDFDNMSFPELREITCFLVLYRVTGLKNIGLLFPNLTVIRGNSLFQDYALVVYEMMQLQEIGLWRLSAILRGSVRIEKNYLLCYYNTVNWDAITNGGENVIAHNKEGKSCPGNAVCGATEGCDKTMCWGSHTEHCPLVHQQKKCHELCLGGCKGPGPKDCYVCRGRLNEGECVKTCPPGRYSYMGRRCLTEAECRAQKIIHPDTFSGGEDKIMYKHSWPFNGTCVYYCPPNYEEERNGTTVVGCLHCRGRCSHECEGGVISTIADAQNLHHCTVLLRSLEISISGSGSHIVQELEEYLSSIEEIKGYLRISRSFPITSFNFLKNLRVIHGTELEEGKYALSVIENQNLQELWNWSSRGHDLKILNGSLRFHYNPQLCLSEIDKLQQISGAPNYTNFDVARESNGDKVACNVVTLYANATVTSSTSAVIEWEPCILPDPSSVVGYVVYYIEASEQNVTEHDGLDACGEYGWRVVDVRYDPVEKTTVGATQQGNLVQFLPHLEPFTQYAFYVKTYTKSNVGGQSKISYFRTLPDKPSVPKEIRATSNSSFNVVLYWLPPEHPNGILTHYIVSGTWQKDSETYLEQRNYCDYPLKHSAHPEIVIIPFSTSNISSHSCCERTESEPLVLIDDPYEYNMLCGSGASKKRKHLNGEIDPCADYFYSFIHSGIPEIRDEHEEESTKFPDIPSSAPSGQRIFASNNTINSDGVYERFFKQISANTTQIIIDKLHHFAQYTISVFACQDPRSVHPSELNRVDIPLSEYKSCSQAGLITVRTQNLSSADKLDESRLSAEVSNGTTRVVRLTWKEPTSPNGMIVAYRVEHHRTDSGTPNQIVKCLTRAEYRKNGGGYVLSNLVPGNYSFRVRTTSLAGDGDFTRWVHFSVEEPPIDTPMGYLAGIIVGVLLVVVGITAAAFLWWKKKSKERSLMIIAEVNPDYMSAIYVEDEWEISRDKLKLLKELGQGSFGMVYEGVLKPGEVQCAVKMINESANVRDKIEFLNEASMMKSFAGAHHVVNLLGVVSKGQPALVVMELMARGDLKTYLRSSRDPPPSPPDLGCMILMAAQIADGMAYLEAHKFVHRDLAARNCMVAADLTVKIGDFGMTRDIYETDYYRNGSKGLLPVRWMSPESLADGVFTSQSDVWSFGVVLWEMTTLAEQPYQGLANEQVLQFVLSGGILERPLCCPDILHQFMMDCWRRRPSQRPRFLQIVADLGAASELGERFKQRSYYHSKEGREMLESMIQHQQDFELACDRNFDERCLSSPPVSFYQLLEEESIPSKAKASNSQRLPGGSCRMSPVSSDDSYVLPGNLRSPGNSRSSKKCQNPLTVPNRHDITDDSYVLPSSLVGPSGRYASEHLSEISETESLLSETSSECKNKPDIVPHNKISSCPIPEDGYVPAENVYIQPDNAVQTSGDCGRTSSVEPRSSGSGSSTENIISQPFSSHSSTPTFTPHNYVPIGNINVENSGNSQTRLPESSGRQPNISVPAPSETVPTNCSGYVPLERKLCQNNRPPNGMVNGFISIPRDEDKQDCV